MTGGRSVGSMFYTLSVRAERDNKNTVASEYKRLNDWILAHPLEIDSEISTENLKKRAEEYRKYFEKIYSFTEEGGNKRPDSKRDEQKLNIEDQATKLNKLIRSGASVNENELRSFVQKVQQYVAYYTNAINDLDEEKGTMFNSIQLYNSDLTKKIVGDLHVNLKEIASLDNLLTHIDSRYRELNIHLAQLATGHGSGNGSGDGDGVGGIKEEEFNKLTERVDKLEESLEDVNAVKFENIQGQVDTLNESVEELKGNVGELKESLEEINNMKVGSTADSDDTHSSHNQSQIVEDNTDDQENRRKELEEDIANLKNTRQQYLLALQAAERKKKVYIEDYNNDTGVSLVNEILGELKDNVANAEDEEEIIELKRSAAKELYEEAQMCYREWSEMRHSGDYEDPDDDEVLSQLGQAKRYFDEARKLFDEINDDDGDYDKLYAPDYNGEDRNATRALNKGKDFLERYKEDYDRDLPKYDAVIEAKQKDIEFIDKVLESKRKELASLNVGTPKYITQQFDNEIQQNLVSLENYKNTIAEIDRLKLEPETDETKRKIEELNKLADYFASKITVISNEGITQVGRAVWCSPGSTNDRVYSSDQKRDFQKVADERHGVWYSNVVTQFYGIDDEINRIEDASNGLLYSLSKNQVESKEYAKSILNAFRSISMGLKYDYASDDVNSYLKEFPELEQFKSIWSKSPDFVRKFASFNNKDFLNVLSQLPKAKEYLSSIGYQFNTDNTVQELNKLENKVEEIETQTVETNTVLTNVGDNLKTDDSVQHLNKLENKLEDVEEEAEETAKAVREIERLNALPLEEKINILRERKKAASEWNRIDNSNEYWRDSNAVAGKMEDLEQRFAENEIVVKYADGTEGHFDMSFDRLLTPGFDYSDRGANYIFRKEIDLRKKIVDVTFEQFDADKENYEYLKSRYDQLVDKYNQLPRRKTVRPEEYIYDYSYAKRYAKFDYDGEDPIIIDDYTDSEDHLKKYKDAYKDRIDSITKAISATYKKITNMKNAINKHSGMLDGVYYIDDDIEIATKGLKGLFEMYIANGGDIEQLNVRMAKPFKEMLKMVNQQVIANNQLKEQYNLETKEILKNNSDQIKSFLELREVIRKLFLDHKHKDSKGFRSIDYLPNVYTEFLLQDDYYLDDNYSFELVCRKLGIGPYKQKFEIGNRNNIKNEPKYFEQPSGQLSIIDDIKESTLAEEKLEQQIKETNDVFDNQISLIEHLETVEKNASASTQRQLYTKDASNNIKDEVAALKTLEAELDKVIQAVNAKTTAFLAEKKAVEKVVQSESYHLGTLLKDIREVHDAFAKMVPENVISSEKADLSTLSGKFNGVTESIENKNKAIYREQTILHDAVGSELCDLENLRLKIETVRKAFANILNATDLKNIDAGSVDIELINQINTLKDTLEGNAKWIANLKNLYDELNKLNLDPQTLAAIELLAPAIRNLPAPIEQLKNAMSGGNAWTKTFEPLATGLKTLKFTDKQVEQIAKIEVALEHIGTLTNNLKDGIGLDTKWITQLGRLSTNIDKIKLTSSASKQINSFVKALKDLKQPVYQLKQTLKDGTGWSKNLDKIYQTIKTFDLDEKQSLGVIGVASALYDLSGAVDNVKYLVDGDQKWLANLSEFSDKLKKLKFSTDDIGNIENAVLAITHMMEEVQKIPSGEIAVLNDVKELLADAENLKNLATILKTVEKDVKKARKKVKGEDKDSSKNQDEVKDVVAEVVDATNGQIINKDTGIETATENTEKFDKAITKARESFSKLKNIYGDTAGFSKIESDLQDEFDQITNQSGLDKFNYNLSNARKELERVQNLAKKGWKTTSFEKMSDALEFYKKIDGVTIKEFKGADGEVRKFTAEFKDQDKQIRKVKVEMNGLNGAIQTFSDVSKNVTFFEKLGPQIKSTFAYFKRYLTGYFSLQEAIQAVRYGVQSIVELDTAMVELRKVSKDSSYAIDKYFSVATESAKELGATVGDLLNATADWSRMGYNLADAKELAEISTLYMHVGDGIDIDQASSSLVSTMKGFHMEAEDAMGIIDKFNEVANTNPIESGGIGEALQRSAASFYMANTDLSSAIALITASNSVVQDPEKVGKHFAHLCSNT